MSLFKGIRTACAYAFRVFRVSLFLLSLLVVCVILNYQYVAWSFDSLAYTDLSNLPERQYGLVLGTSYLVKDGRPNLYFQGRMDAAEQLYKSGKVKQLILSGAVDYGYNEVAKMQEVLEERGIPAEHMIQDPLGYRTIQSILRANQVYGVKQFTIISQAFHNHRALRIAQFHDLDAIAYNAKTVEQDRWMTLFREHLARVKMLLDLYWWKTEAALEPEVAF